MRFSSVISVCTLAVILAGCAGGGRTQLLTRNFPKVTVPEVMAEDQEESLEYILEHFWDGLAEKPSDYLCDSTHVGGVAKEEVEQQFSNFVALLRMSPLPMAQESMRVMYRRMVSCEQADTSSNVFETLVSLSDKYLYNANSPVRDEDIYGALAGELAEYEGYSPEQRLVYAYEHSHCSLNERGTPAADFPFRDARGKSHTLYDVKGTYTLLFFSNPGCEACANIIRTLSELDVNRLISEGKLAIVNVYIDEDIRAWREYMPIYPENWYNGYDPEGIIRDETLYNVRAIPSLYLLDSDKTVLLKDAPEQTIFNVLDQMIREADMAAATQE